MKNQQDHKPARRSFGLAVVFGLAVGIPAYFVAGRIGPSPGDAQALGSMAVLSALILGLAAAAISYFFALRDGEAGGRKVTLVLAAVVILLFAFMIYGMIGAAQNSPVGDIPR